MLYSCRGAIPSLVQSTTDTTGDSTSDVTMYIATKIFFEVISICAPQCKQSVLGRIGMRAMLHDSIELFIRGSIVEHSSEHATRSRIKPLPVSNQQLCKLRTNRQLPGTQPIIGNRYSFIQSREQ